VVRLVSTNTKYENVNIDSVIIIDAKIYYANPKAGTALLLLTISQSIIGAYLFVVSTPYFL
jgi:hypothetical protein